MNCFVSHFLYDRSGSLLVGKRWTLYLAVSLYFCLSLSLCLSLFLSLSPYFCLSLSVSLCLSIAVCEVCLSLCLSHCLSHYLPTYLSVCLHVCLSHCHSLTPSSYLSEWISISCIHFFAVIFFPQWCCRWMQVVLKPFLFLSFLYLCVKRIFGKGRWRGWIP